jgi:hypothetical protein
MSCNYYAIPKMTAEKKLSIIKSVVREDYESAMNLMPQKIHIGKSNIGWRFLFDLNDEIYYTKHRSSIQKYLIQCDIYDEYGDYMDFDEFWNMVYAKQGNKPELEYGCLNGEEGLNFSHYTNFS